MILDDLAKKDLIMSGIIRKIRRCNLKCYADRYIFPLRTSNNRVITIEELISGKPLIDDWRRQTILFISQAPSKQAWVDKVLSSADNYFLADFLLPKIFPELDINAAVEIWRSKVLWIHTSNCYPFVFIEGRNKNRDRLPDLRCVNRYMDEILFEMQPQFIILMSGSATKFFGRSIRMQIGSEKTYPTLKEILKWQHSNNDFLEVGSQNGQIVYKTIAIPHAANWNMLNDDEKYAYNKIKELISKNA